MPKAHRSLPAMGRDAGRCAEQTYLYGAYFFQDMRNQVAAWAADNRSHLIVSLE